MRQYTLQTLIQTYAWVRQHPDGRIPIDYGTTMTSREWIEWFRAKLHEKINVKGGLKMSGRKYSYSYQTGLRRDYRAIHDYTLRRTVYPQNRLCTKELQQRFGWSYSCDDGLEIRLYNRRDAA